MVSRRSSPRGPLPSRVLGRERGCSDTKEKTPRALVCAPQGTQGQGRLFYHKFQPRQYPVLCISPQLGLFPSPRICAHNRPGSRVSLVCTSPSIKSRGGLTHAVTSVVAYKWNHGGQRASRSVASLTISMAMPCCWNRLSVCSWHRLDKALAVSSQGGGDTCARAAAHGNLSLPPTPNSCRPTEQPT